MAEGPSGMRAPVGHDDCLFLPRFRAAPVRGPARGPRQQRLHRENRRIRHAADHHSPRARPAAGGISISIGCSTVCLDLDRSTRSVVPADLYETEEGYGLELELPGFRESEIDVTVDRGVLTIAGARSEEDEETGRTYHVRERRNEHFARSFSLPASIRGEDVAARLDAGVLTVELPKSPEAKPHRVTVGGTT